MNNTGQLIAIVGIGCRFPGGAFDPNSLWQRLLERFDAVTEIPRDRWSISAFYDAEHGRPGKSCAKWGAFLPDIDRFDPGFFGISDAEADAMDPQQRLLLETAWEAMEDAGHVPNPQGERTGVFVGISTRDYETLQGSVVEPNEASPYSATGLASSIAANRLSYCFNFTGPSFAVDTACSSSLLAVHLACQSLWRGECRAAIAAGVNCLLVPNNYIAFSSMGVLSPDGRCMTFDARANGFVRGEGAGAILLRPLRDALADGDRVYATILATGTNQDGRTRGLALPSREAQVALLRETCEQAQVTPRDIVYVEAHGTGTAVGDPAEAAALGEVMGSGRGPGQELLVGSIKTNIGHLEAAAGIAGIIKCALCLQHGAAPPNLHFENPSPGIDFERWRLKVPTEVELFPRLSNNGDPTTWLAGVNSFGFGGSNVFMLLQSQPQRPAPHEAGRPQCAASNGLYLLPISARTSEALKVMARQYADHLDKGSADGGDGLQNVVFSATKRRRHYEHRMTAVGRSRQELRDQLLAFAQGEVLAGASCGETRPCVEPVFVFSGQGAQRPAMARDLYEHEAVFRDMMQRCHEALTKLHGWSLLDEFLSQPAHSRMEDTAIAQPSIFALQVSLAALWDHWGVRPAAVVGHSVGEVAAAYVAGVFDLDTAMKVIYHRGGTMAKVVGHGGMLAAALTEDEARECVAPYGDEVGVGAINGPQSVTLSGNPSVLKEIAERLDAQGRWQRLVPVNYAFHSDQMEPVREPLLTALAGLSPKRSRIPIYSTVTGQRVDGTELDADYWWCNVRQTVRFAPAIEAIARQGHTIFLELNAHPVLSTSIKQCLQQSSANGDGCVLQSLRRHEDDRQVMLSSLGALHCLGCPVRWDHVAPASGHRYVPLPRYAWQRRRHWTEARELSRVRAAEVRHPLLMRRLNMPIPTWLSRADTRLIPYLRDHAVQGRPLFPAAGHIELALAVAAQMFPDQPCCLRDVDIESVLFLPEGSRGANLQIRFDPASHEFSIHSSLGGGEDDWTRHAKGVIRPTRSLGSLGIEDIAEIRDRCTTELESKRLYQQAQQSGFHYGPLFRTVQRVWRRDGEALCEVELPEALRQDADRYRMHPAMFDACLQLAFIVSAETDPHAPVGAFFPYAFDRLSFLAPLGNRFFGHARVVKQGRSTLVLELKAIAEDGRVLAVLEGLRYRPVEGFGADVFMNWFYEFQWRSKPLPPVKRFLPASRPAQFLPAPPTLARVLQTKADATRQRMRQPDLLRKGEPDFDALWRGYLFQVFDDLAWFPQPGDTVTLSAAMAHMGVRPECAPLLRWCFATLTEDGIFSPCPDGDSWRVEAVPDLSESVPTLWRRAMNRFPALFAELMLLKYCGQSLAAILTDDRAAASVCLSDDMAGLLEQARAGAPAWLPSNLIIRHAVAEVVAGLPKGRHLRVLEVDAGRNELSMHVLAELPTLTTQYVVSDASAEALSRAESQLRDYDCVKCEVLDMRRDPVEQGVATGAFDLLIGMDVFSRRSDPRRRLKHALDLLAPGGLLLFSEPDAGARLQQLLLMLRDNSWRVSDGNPQADVSLRKRDDWLLLLKEAGFDEPCVVSDTNGTTEFGRAVYIARRPMTRVGVPSESPSTEASFAQDRSWLILGDSGGFGNTLADALRRQGHEARLVGPEESRGDLTVLLDRDYDGIVHLWSLDAPPCETLSLAALQQSQRLLNESVLRLVQALARRPSAAVQPRLWLVTRNAQPAGENGAPLHVVQASLAGLGRVLANEHPELRCRMVDLAPVMSADDLPSLLAELLADDKEDQVALRGEARYVQRIVRMPTVDGPDRNERGLGKDLPCRLQIGKPGALDLLRFRPLERRGPGPEEVEIEVCAAGLNFRDVMKTLGIYPGEAEDADRLGDEFAGVVVQVGDAAHHLAVGDPVFGMCLGAMATHVTVPAAVALRLPSEFTMEEAATIPVAYFTAFHALHELARMQAGERILIHSAAGGVGQAAVKLALNAGLEVFGTAGSPMKRQFLRDIGVHHVSNSRTLEFADEIMALTGGEGVDIVLNSLAGDALIRSLDLLRLNGRFLELGKRDIYGGTAINLRPFRNSLAYFAIDMARAMSPQQAGPLLAEIRKLIERHVVVPLPYHPLPFGEAPCAFRHMAQGKHTGKIVLTVDQTPVARRSALNAARQDFRPDATYLITGGSRGLGLSLAEQLASRGARHLVLTSSSEPVSEEAQAGLARLRAKKATVLSKVSDVASEVDLSDLLGEIDRTLPPLRGIIHAATVYDDCLLRKMDMATFERPMQPKAYGAWNLHLQTKDRPLDFFVLLSSISSAMGNVGQANYVAANAFCDALAHHRRCLGLPALVIQLDRVQDVGHVARSHELTQFFSRLHWRGIASEQVFEAVQRLLANDVTQSLVTSFHWSRSSTGLGPMLASPRFELVARDDSESGDVTDTTGLRQQLSAATPQEQREIMADFLRREIAEVLRTSALRLPLDQPLKEIGLDSLMAVELMARVESKVGITLSGQQLSANPTVLDLVHAALTRLGGEVPTSPAQPAESVGSQA